MPGFAPVGDIPVGSDDTGGAPPPPTGAYQVASQAVHVALTTEPGFVISTQAVFVAIIKTPVPRRRSGMLIG